MVAADTLADGAMLSIKHTQEIAAAEFGSQVGLEPTTTRLTAIGSLVFASNRRSMFDLERLLYVVLYE